MGPGHVPLGTGIIAQSTRALKSAGISSAPHCFLCYCEDYGYLAFDVTVHKPGVFTYNATLELMSSSLLPFPPDSYGTDLP